MKKFILLLVILFTPVLIYSQTTGFRYDNSGNRTSRTTTIGLKSTSEASGDSKSSESFSDQIGEHSIMIYPNPVESELTIDIQGLEENTESKISLFDQSGRLVLTRDNLAGSNTLNLSHLSAGTYFMIIHMGVGNSKWTIVKE